MATIYLALKRCSLENETLSAKTNDSNSKVVLFFLGTVASPREITSGVEASGLIFFPAPTQGDGHPAILEERFDNRPGHQVFKGCCQVLHSQLWAPPKGGHTMK